MSEKEIKLDAGPAPPDGAKVEPRSSDGRKQGPQFSPARRRLIKVGLVAAPVIMTVANKPTLAGGWSGGGGGGGGNCTPSGQLSGNLSPTQDHHKCVGLTPGYWGQHPNEWSALGYDPGKCVKRRVGKQCKYNEYDGSGTKFFDVFNGPHYPYPPDITMMQVIHLGGTNDRYQVGAHTVAALLNATRYPLGGYYVFGLSPAQVIEMWNTRHLTDPEGLKADFQFMNERGT